MKFIVKSGKHSLSVEAIDFNHAAQLFLSNLIQKEDLKLGDVITVACEVTESFFLTNSALKELGREKLMKLYPGSIHD